MKEKTLKEIINPHDYKKKELIYNWAYISLPKDDGTFVFYKPEKDIGGFCFYVVSELGRAERWADTTVVCEMHGEAYGDGLRHLYYGDEQTDNEGYHYNPHIGHIKSILDVIKDLELAYCTALD